MGGSMGDLGLADTHSVKSLISAAIQQPQLHVAEQKAALGTTVRPSHHAQNLHKTCLNKRIWVAVWGPWAWRLPIQ